MEDYLSESEKWEAIKVWLRENTLWILGGVVLGGALIGGYRWYGDHVDNQALVASTKYQQVIEAFAKGDRTGAASQISLMEHDFPGSPYVDQARLVAARSYVDAGDLDHAAAALQAVVDQSKDKNVALISRLRLARVQIALKKPDNALATLTAATPGAFAPRFHEVQGDAYHAKGDDASALREYQMARTGDLTGVTDTQLLDLKINDLLADAGTTSKPTQPPAAAAAK